MSHKFSNKLSKLKEMVCLHTLNQDCENRLTFTLILASAASVQHVGPTVVAAVTALRTQNSQASRPSGHLVQLPGFPMPLAPSLRPQTVSANPPGVASGYNLNHIGYQATRANIASNAYAGNSGQIVLVEVCAVRLPEGKLKPILIGVSFSNDPSTQEPSSNVNIGPARSCSQHSASYWCNQVENYSIPRNFTQWMRYSEQYPLSITDFIMRDKDWVEIHPRIPDRDAILCPSFFKSAKNGSQTVFKGGKAIVQFHIPNNVYARYGAWIEEREFHLMNL